MLITITKAALERLNIEEQFAVVDHELGHTKRWKEDFILDLYLILPLAFIILVLSCAVLILIFKGILSSGFVKSIFLLGAITCLFLFLIVRFLKVDYIITIKRQSEFGADEVSAKLGNAQALISVLEKRDKLDKKDRFKEILFVFFQRTHIQPSLKERKN